MKTLTIFSEITKPRALIFGVNNHLVTLFQVCSNYFPGAKNALPQGHMFNIGLCRINMEKNFLSENIRLRTLIFGM